MLASEYYNLNYLNTLTNFVEFCLNVLLSYMTSFYFWGFNFFMLCFRFRAHNSLSIQAQIYSVENISKPIIIHTSLKYRRSPLHQKKKKKLTSFVAILGLIPDVNFQAKPSKWGLIYSQKLYCTACEGPLTTDQSHSYLGSQCV